MHPRCKECFQKSLYLVLGRCRECYIEFVETSGELPLLVHELGNSGPEAYEYIDNGTVFASFYRLEFHEGFWVVKTNERQWCMRLEYKAYPCPPIISFVNKHNRQDNSPLWVPRGKFVVDRVKQIFDLPDLDLRCSAKDYIPQENMPIHRYSPDHYVTMIAPQIENNLASL